MLCAVANGAEFPGSLFYYIFQILRIVCGLSAQVLRGIAGEGQTGRSHLAIV